jgi:hypothetical protein
MATKKKETNNIKSSVKITDIPISEDKLRKLIKSITKEELAKLDKEKLQQLFDGAKKAYSGDNIKISRKERQVLYVIQEELFGKLDPKVVSSLERIGETLVKNPDRRKKKVDYHLPSSGAIIAKDWKGKKLEVKILDSGYEYQGEIFKSLSNLAKHITGYAVSGPIFFGLRKNQKLSS